MGSRAKMIVAAAVLIAAAIAVRQGVGWRAERLERDRRAAETAVNEADNLLDPEAAAAAYDAVIARYGNNADPRIRGAVVKAMLGKASHSRDEAEQARLLDGAIPWLEKNAADPGDEFNLCLSLLTRAELSDDSGEKIALVDRLLARYGESREPELQGQIARALWLKAEETGDRLEKVRLLDQVIERYGTSRDPEVSWEVAKAINVKADSTSSVPEKIRLYGQVASRYGGESGVYLRGQVVYALMRQAELVDDVEKRAIYERVAGEYADSGDAFIRESVRQAAEAARALSAAGTHGDGEAGEREDAAP